MRHGTGEDDHIPSGRPQQSLNDVRDCCHIRHDVAVLSASLAAPGSSTATPPSPVPRRVRGPRWLDARLLLGIALVLGCVLAGALVFSRVTRTQQVWAISHDVAAGAVLQPADLRPVPVRLPDSADSYVLASDSLVGKTVYRPLTAGELVPRAAVTTTAAATSLTIPLDAKSAPSLARGERIKVWVSSKKCAELPLLNDVTVQDVTATGGSAFVSGQGQAVVVRVPGELADRVVTALALDGAVLRAGVLDGPVDPSQAGPAASLPSLTACTGA